MKRIPGSLPQLVATLGSRLRGLRLAAGLTGQEVWARTGIDPGNLSRMENGKRVPTLGTLVTLADLYATPVSVILQSPAAHDATEVRAPIAEASWAATADAQG